MDASAIRGEQVRQEVKISRLAQRFSGEGLTFGIEKEQIAEFIAQRGFTDVAVAGAEDLKRLYFTGSNQKRAVGEIYAIVQAAVP